MLKPRDIQVLKSFTLQENAIEVSVKEGHEFYTRKFIISYLVFSAISYRRKEKCIVTEISLENESLKKKSFPFAKQKIYFIKMVVRIEPKKLVIGNEDSEGFKILQKATWMPFLHNFSRYNMEVTK